ncbi:MAG TPA: DUF2231 domain-containing protein [Fredinandcohnia sp.]|nr:DUF2231 domain-containing protein [Fredinandcohnia sp.]
MRPHEMGNGRADAWVERIEENRRLENLSDPLQEGVRGLFGQGAGATVRSVLRGEFLGHPLHPALTDLPIGAWTAGLVFDLASLGGSRELARAAQASVAVGVVGAIGAAVTGLADWSETEGKAQRVGVVHAALNAVGLGLQIASLAQRRSGRGSGRLLSALGCACAFASAYLGGKLVYRLGTGVKVSQRAAYSARGAERYGADLPRDFQ